MLALALALAGCAARAKSSTANTAAAKPAPPSAPPAPVALSIPQTQIELPKPQPFDKAALETEIPPATPAEPPMPARTPTPPKRTPPARTEPATPSPVVSAEPERQQFQPVISAADLKRFQDSAQNRKREVARILGQLKHLTKAQQNVVNSIRSFVSLSDEAEKRSDMGQADALAERAQILARDLQHGK
jgi:hypothetical protein